MYCCCNVPVCTWQSLQTTVIDAVLRLRPASVSYWTPTLTVLPPATTSAFLCQSSNILRININTLGHGPDMVHVHPRHNSTRQDFLSIRFLWTWNQLVTVKILVCTIHLAQMLDCTPKTLNFRRYHAVIFVCTLSSIFVAPHGSITMHYIPAERHFLLMKVVSFTFSYDGATYFKILTKQLQPTFLCAIPNKLVKMLFAINITLQWI